MFLPIGFWVFVEQYPFVSFQETDIWVQRYIFSCKIHLIINPDGSCIDTSIKIRHRLCHTFCRLRYPVRWDSVAKIYIPV